MLFIIGEKIDPKTDLDVAVITLDPAIPRPGDWIVDSGATSHVTGSVGAFINYHPYRHSDSTNESNTPQLVPLSTGPGYDFEDFAPPAVVIETPDNPTELVFSPKDSSLLVAVSKNPNEPILPPKPDEPKEPTWTPGDSISETSQGVLQVCRRCGDNLSIDINWQPAGGGDTEGHTSRSDAAASYLIEPGDMAFLAAVSPRTYTNTVTDPESTHRNIAKFSHLGLSVVCEPERQQIQIDERDYLQKKKVEMHASEGRATPMESKPVPRRQGGEPADHNWYHQAVGHVLYDTRRRYPIGVLGRFAGDPSIHHWKAIKHLLRYIKGTLYLSLPLVHKGVSATGLVAYADADHGGDPVASKSTSGYLVYADGILIHWKSKKQRVVAQSTMEAELIAIAETWKCMQWVRDGLSELGHWPSGHRTLLYNDNQSAVQVLSSGNFSTDCRHMRMRFHLLVDCINKHELAIEYVPTGEMWADGLTKGLGGVKHREFLNMMGLEY